LSPRALGEGMASLAKTKDLPPGAADRIADLKSEIAQKIYGTVNEELDSGELQRRRLEKIKVRLREALVRE